MARLEKREREKDLINYVCNFSCLILLFILVIMSFLPYK